MSVHLVSASSAVIPVAPVTRNVDELSLVTMGIFLTSPAHFDKPFLTDKRSLRTGSMMSLIIFARVLVSAFASSS